MARITGFCLTAAVLATAPVWPVDYDIVYVRQRRFGDRVKAFYPEVRNPAAIDPGADLMLLHPDGSQEVLVACSQEAGGSGRCAVTDPVVSFDGRSVYFSLFHDVRDRPRNNSLPAVGSDIFRIDLDSRRLRQLTRGEFTPNTGAGSWDLSNPAAPARGLNGLGYGILNLGPMPLPGGRIAFTSNRNGFDPPRGLTTPSLQLFVMSEDGTGVEPIAPMTIGSALHPTVLRDGRLMFSSLESQGVRDGRLWGLWTIYPDGRHWEPLVSAFAAPLAVHFSTQLTDESIVAVLYYNRNNNGFGTLLRFPVRPPDGEPRFHSAFADDNPELRRTSGRSGCGKSSSFWVPFSPRGLYSLTPFTHPQDHAAPCGSAGGARVGKVTHPSAAPDGDLLLVWSPGPANDQERPTNLPRYDGGIYLLPAAGVVEDPLRDLIVIKNSPRHNEAWPRAVVPYSAIHGLAAPEEIPWLPNDGSLHELLPAGTASGLVGSSSIYRRESAPGQGVEAWAGLDPFNTSKNGASSNWSSQGADAGLYGNGKIWAVRIVALEPNSHRRRGPDAGRKFKSFANERMRILGEIPLRKFDAAGNPILDPEGNPDTSFLVKIPADTPFTFQTIDRKGMVLNMAQTWHQVRPGEVRTDCGGCHAHSLSPLAFADTAAARPDYQVYDLGRVTPLVTRGENGEMGLDVRPARVINVEFTRDVRPLLQRRVVDPGSLPDLDFSAPNLWQRLADDARASWSLPSVLESGRYRQTNASRYVRKFQSRRSLLIWSLFGARFDGWSNADHPTERVPGLPATLPSGSDPDQADLDYVGRTVFDPELTMAEKMTVARWIDLGAPLHTGPRGFYLDDLRPTLTISQPRPGVIAVPPPEIRLAVADANSGVERASLSLTATFEVQGRAPGAELADLCDWADDICTVTGGGGSALAPHAVFAAVSDRQGNISRRSVGAMLFADSFEDGALSPRWVFQEGTWIETAGALRGTAESDIGADAKARAVGDPTLVSCDQCSVRATLESTGGSAGGGETHARLLAWYESKQSNVSVTLKPAEDKIVFRHKRDKVTVTRATVDSPLEEGRPYRIKIRFDGWRFRVFVDGALLFDEPNRGGVRPFGTVGFQARSSDLAVHDLAVYP